MDFPEITLRAVGFVKSEIKEPVLRADNNGITLEEKLKKVKIENDKIKTMISEIVIEPDFAELLDDIDDYSHILVLFWAHKVPEASRKLTKVHPMGLKDIPRKGIFATCSPARPNPVLVTAVKLIERKGNILKIQGFEAIDGTPVIDIKPYVEGYHRVESPTRPEWMENIHRQLESL
ncbi:conserved hypothetical protein [Desulfamplus magnetovallimortis]|uniref:TsaA-like domain-containing protein n=1 Tax=Desulfamplus magnetovallimortis TaxID=1246637 RepID=A0A1W1HHP1_9BACT|nr:tRNA (N6-threonylcarbamoyladenosine(37)-N6)-methyltransferase TrmO [Desulfamplus magnetovallimortis]SLM31892.1 conserved hypothetical protein [Desulfamplus magnetovallimortis]